MRMRFLPLTLMLCLTLLACGSAAAKAPLPPGWKAGNTEVFLLNDGGGEADSSILIGASPELIAKYYPNKTTPSTFNAFLVREGGKNILVDTGFGKGIHDGLKALGLGAGDIDLVLITHMHGDHIGGLVKDGKAAFPKAEVYVAEKERAYWSSEANMKAAPEGKKAGFTMAVESLKPYADKVSVFTPGGLEEKGVEIAPGIRAIAAYGHTPGHTMFLVGGDGGELLIWGDLTHALGVQMEAPEIAVTYDVDPKEAVATREKVLRFVAEKNIPVAGMHIVPPAMGFVRAKTQGKGYSFIPLGSK